MKLKVPEERENIVRIGNITYTEEDLPALEMV